MMFRMRSLRDAFLNEYTMSRYVYSVDPSGRRTYRGGYSFWYPPFPVFKPWSAMNDDMSRYAPCGTPLSFFCVCGTK
eukprot:30911-Pelagococcus_subviridis.AAC.10